MIDRETEAQIVRLHFVEKWRPGTIGRHLNLHHGVVERVLGRAGVPATSLGRAGGLDRLATSAPESRRMLEIMAQRGLNLEQPQPPCCDASMAPVRAQSTRPSSTRSRRVALTPKPSGASSMKNAEN